MVRKNKNIIIYKKDNIYNDVKINKNLKNMLS